jgi:hypothetical protein
VSGIRNLQSIREEWYHYGDLCNASFNWLEGTVSDLNAQIVKLNLEKTRLVDQNRRLAALVEARDEELAGFYDD